MTKEISFPYGKEKLIYEFDSKKLSGIPTSSIEEYNPEDDEITIVKKALEEPIGSLKLSDLTRGRKILLLL